MAKRCLMRCHAPICEFQHQTRDRRMERCVLARFPLEGRSVRDAPVGVLVCRNRGHQKISPEKVVGNKVFRRWLWLY